MQFSNFQESLTSGIYIHQIPEATKLGKAQCRNFFTGHNIHPFNEEQKHLEMGTWMMIYLQPMSNHTNTKLKTQASPLSLADPPDRYQENHSTLTSSYHFSSRQPLDYYHYAMWPTPSCLPDLMGGSFLPR